MLARIERCRRVAPLVAAREAIAVRFKEIGFTHTSLDLAGYRQGGVNEALAAVAKAEHTRHAPENIRAGEKFLKGYSWTCVHVHEYPFSPM